MASSSHSFLHQVFVLSLFTLCFDKCGTWGFNEGSVLPTAVQQLAAPELGFHRRPPDSPRASLSPSVLRGCGGCSHCPPPSLLSRPVFAQPQPLPSQQPQALGGWEPRGAASSVSMVMRGGGDWGGGDQLLSCWVSISPLAPCLPVSRLPTLILCKSNEVSWAKRTWALLSSFSPLSLSPVLKGSLPSCLHPQQQESWFA